MSFLIRYFNDYQKLSEEDKACIAAYIKTVKLPVGQRWAPHHHSAIILAVQEGLARRVSYKPLRDNSLDCCVEAGDGFSPRKRDFKWRYEAIEPTVIHYIEEQDFEKLSVQYPRLNRLPTYFHFYAERKVDQENPFKSCLGVPRNYSSNL